MKKGKKAFRMGHLLAHIILILGGFIMFYPVIFILLASMFTPAEFNTSQIGFLPLAKNPTFNNIKTLFFISINKANMTFYVNSIMRTVYGTSCAVITAMLSGYVFSRLKFRGRDVLFVILLGTTMIPGIISVMPTYLELAKFPFTGGSGLLNTWGVYILLHGPSINIMGMFLMKQSLEKTPMELDEAAKVDGAGVLHIIFKILMPLQKPVLAYIAITTSIGLWNDWQTPFYYTNSSKIQTISSVLTRLTAFAGKEGELPNYPAIMTFSLMLTIPSVILFFLFQKQIVQGLANTGIKG